MASAAEQLLTFRLAAEARLTCCVAGRTARPATKSDTERSKASIPGDGELGLAEESRGEGEEFKTGSRMSAAPRRPRPTPPDPRPEQNNDLASERDQLNGVGGGDSRERSGSRRGRRRVASLRGGEKGRTRQNQGQVSATVHVKPILICTSFFLNRPMHSF